jgi:hypothetical protein
MKLGADQAAVLRILEQFCSPPIESQIIFRKSLAAMRDGENRKGIPKLDSAGISAPLEFENVGGGEHCAHFILEASTALIMASNGFDFSFDSVRVLPSSHKTSMPFAVSDCFTHRVVLTLAEACGVRVAARPVWHTPP